MKKRKKAKAKKASVPTVKPHTAINADKYLKNKVLVFKLRTQIKHELQDDRRELKNLVRLVRRAKKFAA